MGICHTTARLIPDDMLTDTVAVFETFVGLIHRNNERTRLVVQAERGEPVLAEVDVPRLVTENRHATVDLFTSHRRKRGG